MDPLSRVGTEKIFREHLESQNAETEGTGLGAHLSGSSPDQQVQPLFKHIHPARS